MPFALSPDHRDFFIKNNYIGLEGILPKDQVDLLKTNAEALLASRLRTPSADPYKLGYDLWRENAFIKKIAHKKTFAELASELFEAIPLRFAFDQYICTSPKNAPPFSEALSLQETSCISPLAGALILPLEDLPESLPFFPIPKQSGSGLFVSHAFSIPWTQLYQVPNIKLFILAYALKKCYFRPDTRDPHAVDLKRLGYVFNDPLKDAVHPLLLRK